MMDNNLASQFLNQINNIIDYKLSGLTQIKSAIVHSINQNSTVNIYIPPNKTIYHNVQNQSIYQNLQSGDNVKVIVENGSVGNMWIIGMFSSDSSRNTISLLANNDIQTEQNQEGPPMYDRVEYLTSEQFLGKPVYTQVVRMTTANVGSESDAIIYSGESDQDIYIVGIEGILYNERAQQTYAFPVVDPNDGSISATLRIETVNDEYGCLWYLKVKTLTSLSANYAADIIVKYIK